MTLSEWLSQRDSHSAYGVKVLEELCDKFPFTWAFNRGDHTSVMLEHLPSGRRYWISGMSGKAFAKAASNPRNPKGPISAAPGVEDEEIMFGGWQLSDAIAATFTGQTSEKLGRGYVFRDNLQLVRECEEGVSA